MRITRVPLTESGWFILDGHTVVGSTNDEQLARQFAASGALLEIYQKLIKAGKYRGGGAVALDYIHLVAEAVDMAQELQTEGEPGGTTIKTTEANAHLIADMLAVCQLLEKYHQQSDGGFDFEGSWSTLQEAVVAAIAVIAKVESGND